MALRAISSSFNRRLNDRRGFVLIAVLVVFSISLVLFGVWAKAAVRQHRRARNEQVRLQAVRLAEAGVRRGLALHEANPEFTQETWSVPAGVLDEKRTAEVRIRVIPITDGSPQRMTATADFPLGTTQRVRITRQIEITESEPRNVP